MPSSGTRPDRSQASGDHWVHRFHCGAGTVSGSGRFEVRRGRTLGARLLAMLLRLPRSGTAVPVQVRVERDSGGRAEIWTRTFGRRRLVSQQYRVGDRVVERIGPVELVLRETIESDQVGYEQRGTRLRLTGTSMPLPAWASPQIRAAARACGRTRFLVVVTVALPRGKPLLTYSGILGEEAPRW